MTRRGLPPVIRIAVALVFGVAVGIVVAATLPTAVAGLATVAVATPEKVPWITSRLTAFVAYLALTGSVVYGLLLSTKILDAIAHRPVSFALHQDLAAVGLGLAGVHGALLALDRTIHFTLLDLLVPFASPYRPVAVGLGQIALYLVILVTLSFYARRRIGTRSWRMLHYVTFLAFAGATAHGILAGTDTTQPWAFAIYTVSAIAVVFLTTYRIVLALATARDRRGARETTGQTAGHPTGGSRSAARAASRRGPGGTSRDGGGAPSPSPRAVAVPDTGSSERRDGRSFRRPRDGPGDGGGGPPRRPLARSPHLARCGARRPRRTLSTSDHPPLTAGCTPPRDAAVG